MIALTIKIAIFLTIFILGELLVHFAIFKPLKNYFRSVQKKSESLNTNADENECKINDKQEENSDSERPFLGFNISTFKGILERCVLYLALVINITQILIVYGALKIGTRIAGSPKIENDYFIIGNFTSILISLVYMFCYNKVSIEILQF